MPKIEQDYDYEAIRARMNDLLNNEFQKNESAMAKSAGLNRTTLRNILRGETQSISFGVINAVLHAVPVTHKWLVFGEGDRVDRNWSSRVRPDADSRNNKVTESVDPARLADGLLEIHPNRASAFQNFLSYWNEYDEIIIVGSSLEGFERSSAIELRDLLAQKLDNPSASIQILMTSLDSAPLRDIQENETNGYIGKQIVNTVEKLIEVKQMNCKGQLEWKFFAGAPTCFMMAAGPYMLLNPYMYMLRAYNNFSMIVVDTKNFYDLYNRYMEYHFLRAWNHESSTSELTNPL